MGNYENFKLGDVVLVKDTYLGCTYTVHCVQIIQYLDSDCNIRMKFTFAVDENEDHNIHYIVGEDRSDIMTLFIKVVGNILD